MEDKHTKRINQYFQDLIEEKDYLSENVERIISHASKQVKSLTTQAPSSEKEKLLTFLTKSLALFCEVNSTVLKCLESESIPEKPETHSENILENSGHNIQEVEDYYKGFDIVRMQGSPEEGPKVPNSQAQNDFYFRKPLNDSTIKAICKTKIQSAREESAATPITNPQQDPVMETTKPNSIIIHENKSAPTSELANNLEDSDAFSTVSTGTYSHPLSQLRPPTEIPEEYDNKDLETVRENIVYFKEKLGLETQDFAQMSNHYNKDSQGSNYLFEVPVKEKGGTKVDVGAIQPEVLLNNNNNNNNNVAAEQKCLVPELVMNNQLPVVPPRNTGAIKKQTVTQADFMDFTHEDSAESDTCNKVTSWLTNNEIKRMTPPQPDRAAISAVEKLGQNKRHDRNEEIWEKIKDDVPELNFVPATKVIKNALSSSSSEKSFKTKSPKRSKVNMEPTVYVLKPMETPSVGTVCVFSHIVSPSEFYLQVCNHKHGGYEDLIRYELELKFSKSESPFKTKQAAEEKLGQFCCGYVLKEQSWYRLRMLDWKLEDSSDEVIVHAVDFGFKCSTSYKYLRELTSEIARVPMLSIKCHFPLLYPPGSTYLNRLTTWPEQSKEGFEEIVNLNSAVSNDISFFEIVFAQLEGDSLGVDLQDNARKHPDTLGRFLVDTCLAQEIIDEYEDSPELGAFLDDIDILEEADNQNEYLIGYDPKDEMRICRFTKNDGTCFKGKNCKLEHVVLKDGYTTDKIAVYYSATRDPILPLSGEIIQVLPTAYLDSCTYLVQLVRNPIKVCEANNMIMDREMEKMVRAMNHPKSIMKYQPFKILPSMGEFILAFQASTNQWVRVVVRMLNVNDDESLLQVYSVDFGDEFYVTKKDIRKMPEQFIHLPFQIIQVYLEKYERASSFDEKKWKRFFNKHISYKLFFAHLRSNELPFKVQLQTLKGVDIGPTLVKEHLAQPRTIDCCMNEDPLKRQNQGSFNYLDLE